MDLHADWLKDQADFLAQLKDYPHSFLMRDLDHLSFERLQAGLEAALTVGYTTDLEEVRARNLLAYLLQHQKKQTDALQVTENAIKINGQQNNIVSLANKAVILWHIGRRQEAQQQVLLLNALKKTDDFYYLLIKAKGELAFSYTRMGPQFWPTAISTFKEILACAKEPEKWLWRFGLALTYRRALNPRHIHILGQSASQKDLSDLTWQLLDEVIQGSSSTNLQAKAYSEMALLLFNNRKDAKFLAKVGWTHLQACQEALRKDDKDFSVLVKIGKVFRYERRTKESLDYLLKALSMRCSSAVHHHLGLTYKALAKEKNGPRKKPMSRTAVHRKHVGHDIQSAMGREARALMKMIKTPINNVGEFKWTDEFIPQTMDHFKEAVDFSRGENLRASYDLALMYKALGEPFKALSCLEQIRNSHIVGAFDKVNACEQTGLILKDLSEQEKDKTRKSNLAEEAESMLMLALQSAIRNFRQHPHIKPHICTIWHSFSVLLTAKDGSKNPEHKKLLEKAQLYQLVENHKEALAILQEIKTIAPEEGNRPLCLEMLAKSYCESERYGEAVTIIELLKCSQAEYSAADQPTRLDFTQVYLKAAQQHLLRSPTTSFARFCFRNAFTDSFKKTAPTSILQSNVCDRMEQMAISNHSDNEERKMWDVMVLHGTQDDETAKPLAELMFNIYDLKVTCMSNDVLPGTLILNGILETMQKSHLLVFLISQNDTVLEYCINQAIILRAKIVTLTVNNIKTPNLLASFPNMLYPSELFGFGIRTGNPGENASCDNKSFNKFDKILVNGFCKLFCFFANIPETKFL